MLYQLCSCEREEERINNLCCKKNRKLRVEDDKQCGDTEEVKKLGKEGRGDGIL